MFLTGGFRPFFLAGALWVPVALLGWLLMLTGGLQLPSAFDPLSWHQHELLFGFAAAIVAGFALTAVPNWTGRLPLHGLPLALLALLWVVGRLAVSTSAIIGATPALLVDVGFLVTLTGLVLREILSGSNWRNLPIVLLLAIFATANLVSHLEPTGFGSAGSSALGHRLAIAVLVLLIGLIGGRVVPSFTRNWLAKREARQLPASFGRFDKVALMVLAVALLGWAIAPSHGLTGLLLTLAGLLHGIRLVRWQGWQTAREPLVLILHVGYAWLPLGLLLVGLEPLWPKIWPFASLHALTAGAIGTMPLAIMTRATLGHTGRELHAGPATVVIYTCTVVGALLRVVSPLLPLEPLVSFGAAALLWSAGFVLFALVYGPMLVRPRIESPA